MDDPHLLVTLAFAGTLSVALAAATALRGWRDWLELKRLQAGARGGSARMPARNGADLSSLRDRVRRLEAIADGSDAQGRSAI